MGKRNKVTTRDIAEYTGVSQSTVSMILSNKPHVSFSKETIDKVRQGAKELGYKKPVAGVKKKEQALAKSIIVICPLLSNGYYSMIIHSITERAKDYGYTVFTVSTSGSKSFYQQNNSKWVTYPYLQINTRMAGVLGFSAEQSGGMSGAHLCNDGSNVWCMTYGPNGANWMNTSNGAFAISASALVIPVPVSGTYKVRVYGYTN